MKYWFDKSYHSLDYEAKTVFGKKLYKISLNGGMSCPNRDGTIGEGGCIFCSSGGSGDFAANACMPVPMQLKEAKERICRKLPIGKPYGFIAYFQAYTNTYGPIWHLRNIFTEAIQDPSVEVLSIATRPDCLGEDVLALLRQLNTVKPVWVELGLQTMHEKTAKWMRRGYELSVYEKAVKDLKACGIQVITHIIIGLPGERKKELLETIAYLNKVGTDGVKLQLLHILKGTDLAEEFELGKVKALSFEEYEDLLFACITYLKEEIVIHRITGDGPKALLLAPLWTGDKKYVLNTMAKDMREQEIFQGKEYHET